jgi:hypothetical protein
MTTRASSQNAPNYIKDPSRLNIILTATNYTKFRRCYLNLAYAAGLGEPFLTGEQKMPTSGSVVDRLPALYTILANGISEDMDYVVQHVKIGDLQGMFMSLEAHFNSHSKHTMRDRKSRFLRSVFKGSVSFSRFASDLRAEASAINACFGSDQPDLHIGESEVINTLIGAVRIEYSGVFKSVIDIMDNDTVDRTYAEVVQTMIGSARDASLESEPNQEYVSRSANLSMSLPDYQEQVNATWTHGRTRNPDKQPCFKFEKTG